jgi:hypothetical protein
LKFPAVSNPSATILLGLDEGGEQVSSESAPVYSDTGVDAKLKWDQRGGRASPDLTLVLDDRQGPVNSAERDRQYDSLWSKRDMNLVGSVERSSSRSPRMQTLLPVGHAMPL